MQPHPTAPASKEKHGPDQEQQSGGSLDLGEWHSSACVCVLKRSRSNASRKLPGERLRVVKPRGVPTWTEGAAPETAAKERIDLTCPARLAQLLGFIK